MTNNPSVVGLVPSASCKSSGGDGAEKDVGVRSPGATEGAIRGPVEVLCDEIGYPYDPSLARVDVFVSFVSVLVDEIADMITWRSAISRGFSEKGYETQAAMKPLMAVRKMLALDPLLVSERDAMCAALHNEMDQPDDGPCNRFLEMLSSCVSAIRFGLEIPCHSRHAAEAASHIWEHKYGVRLFDEWTSAWQKDWSRGKLGEAVANATAASRDGKVAATKSYIADAKRAYARPANTSAGRHETPTDTEVKERT